MSRLHTSVRGDAHAYTRSRSPWILSAPGAACGRLVHYISGGGMRAFGRTVRQEEIRRRHVGFWVVVTAVAALWAVFWVF